jgi:hypothetical protein
VVETLTGFLRNLTGPLAQYNGTLVRPKQLAPVDGIAQYFVDLETVQLVVGPHQFDCVKDRDAVGHAEKLMRQLVKNKSLMSGHNRGNTRVSIAAITQKINTALAHQGHDIKTMFEALDADGNGGIDKQEFQYGMHKLGIEITVSRHTANGPPASSYPPAHPPHLISCRTRCPT